MKKLFIALMCMAAVAFTSCSSDPLTSGTKGSNLTAEKVEKMDNKTEKCWHIAAKGKVNGEKKSGETYVWCTEQEVAYGVMVEYQMWEKHKAESGIEDFEVAYKEASAKSKDKCRELAEEAEKNNDKDFHF